MRRKLFTSFVLLFCHIAPLFAESQVVTYPAPNSEKMQTGYKVFANGKPVDIYKALSQEFTGGEYYFCYFDFEGPVEVKVVSAHQFKEKPELYPAREFSQDGNSIVFKADKPFTTCLFRKQRESPLIIFGNPIEKDIPNKDDPNVVYFGPGIHVPEKPIELKSNQTLYLAGGAYVKGRLNASGDNITVRGRGILTGELSERFSSFFVNFDRCNNLTIKDIILKDTMTWTLILRDCDKVNIDNIKICCSRMLNDDGIDICNSSNVTIRNSFVRAQDDIIAIKGMRGKKACENILVEDSILWTDVANTFRIGYVCEAEAMRNIVCRNCDIPFYSINYRDPTHYWSNAIIWLQPANEMPIHDVHFENLRIRSDGSDIIVLSANPRVTSYKGSKTAGTLRDCTIKNLSVDGKKGKFKGILYFKGFDEKHDVKNITLENITYFGEKIKADSPCVQIGEFTSGITIK